MSNLDYQQATEESPEQPEPHAPYTGIPRATLGTTERSVGRSWSVARLLPTIIGFIVTIILVALLLAWWL